MPKQTAAAARRATVEIDPALKKQWDALAHALDEAARKGASAFDALWEAASAIVEHEPPLYVVGGYRDAADFFRKKLGETKRNAYRYMRVAKFASPHDEEKYGTTKLDAALSYIEAKLGAPLVHPPLPVAFDRLRIPVSRDGAAAKSVPLADARVEDIVAATRALAKHASKPTSSAERVLAEALKRTPSLARARARVRGGVVSFTGVPLDALVAFADAVRSAKVPAATPKRKAAPKR